MATGSRRGTGTAAAITLGAGTLVLPFSTLYFSHVLAALLSFAAFALVWRERERPREARARGGSRSPALLAGLAVVCEYPLAHRRRDRRPLRAHAARGPGSCAARSPTAAGSRPGVAPLLAYNVVGVRLAAAPRPTPTRSRRPGAAGHAVLGLNDGGFFGITLPRPADALELLFSGRGLLTLAPVLVMAIVGRRAAAPRGRHRAEATDDHRDRARLLPLQRRLLAAVRRRLAGPALPHPDAAVPRARRSRWRGGAGPR